MLFVFAFPNSPPPVEVVVLDWPNIPVPVEDVVLAPKPPKELVPAFTAT